LALEGQGRIGEYVGGYSEWLRQRPPGQPAAPAAATSAARIETPRTKTKPKLSFKDQRTLEQLPARIEQLETEIAARTAAMNDSAFFQQDSSAIVQANQTLIALQADLDTAYAQWAELDG
jgi:ATP-binding cassette subfamily F protein uup